VSWLLFLGCVSFSLGSVVAFWLEPGQHALLLGARITRVFPRMAALHSGVGGAEKDRQGGQVMQNILDHC